MLAVWHSEMRKLFVRRNFAGQSHTAKTDGMLAGRRTKSCEISTQATYTLAVLDYWALECFV